MSNTWKTSNSRSTNYRRSTTGRTTYGYNYGTGSYGSRGGSSNWVTPNYPSNSPQFNTAKEECECRMGSYENIYTQCSSAGKTSFSPTTANKFVKYVNNGAYVYKFNNAEFRRFFGGNFTTSTNSSWTPTTCCRFLQKKFGQGIKAVAKGKGNNWLVCASSNVSARPFVNYDWK